MTPLARQYIATAKHHEKMARVFRSLGKENEAKAADEAARKCWVLGGVFDKSQELEREEPR